MGYYLHFNTYQPVSYTHLDVYKRQQFQPRADVGFRLAELTHQRLDGMASRLDGLVIGRGLLAGFHVLALQVLRDGRILGLGVRKIPDKGRNVFQDVYKRQRSAYLLIR